MKKFFLFTVILTILYPALNFADESGFITVWQTNNKVNEPFGFGNTDRKMSPEDRQITLPFVPDGIYRCVVDWGDGTIDKIAGYDDERITHTYEKPGAYTVEITGTIAGWAFDANGDCEELREIPQWGPFSFGPGRISEGAFNGCRFLRITAKDNPDVSGLGQMRR